MAIMGLPRLVQTTGTKEVLVAPPEGYLVI